MTSQPAGADPGRAAVEAERRRIQGRTLAVLVVCQVVGGLGIGVALTVGSLVAADLSGSSAWGGAASTMITLGSAASAVPLARRAARVGRRPALALGWSIAAGGSLLAAASVWVGWFPLLLVGLGLVGAALAANLQSRYAATDLAAPRGRGRALSVVLWATTIGSVVGPNLGSPSAEAARALGWPPMVGPFVLTTVACLASALALVVWLRPDPLRTAQVLVPEDARRAAAPPLPRRGSGGHGSAAIRASGAARLAVLVLVTVQAVMVGVMAMTPVHLAHHGASLTIVGLTISLHIAGMFALSPVFGVLADRWGRRPVMLLGTVVLVVACALGGTAPAGGIQLSTGLFLLGVGWSAGMVAGSAALSDAIASQDRPAAQGVADGLMGLSGAVAGALSGVVLAGLGFPGLSAAAALLTLPALLALVRRER